MDKVYLIMATNGQDYEDYRNWPCFFVSTEEEAKLFVEKAEEEIGRLYQEAYDYQHKIDYAKSFDETAAGKRYVKYLKQQGIIDKREKYPSASRHTLYYVEMSKRTVA